MLVVSNKGDIRTSAGFPDGESGLMGHKRGDVVRRMFSTCVLSVSCVNDVWFHSLLREQNIFSRLGVNKGEVER